MGDGQGAAESTLATLVCRFIRLARKYVEKGVDNNFQEPASTSKLETVCPSLRTSFGPRANLAAC